MHRVVIPALFLILSLVAPVLAQPAPEPRASVGPLAPGASTEVVIAVDIPDGYHAQSNKPLDENLIPFEVALDPSPGLTVGEIRYPPAEMKAYPVIGEMSVFGGEVRVVVPISVSADADVNALSLSATVTYQICDDKGTCYAPQTKAVQVIGTAVDASAPPVAVAPTPANGAAPPYGEREAKQIKSLWFALGTSVLAGLLFNVMPCVLPVLPLKALGFYEASQHSRERSMMLGAAFSGGLIAVFMALALLVIASKLVFDDKLQWGQWFAYGWVVWTLSAVMLALGLSLLGAFAVRVPTYFYGLSFRHDTIAGNVQWGALTAVLSTPCTAPLFAPVMLYATAQPLWVGAAIMLGVGIGMALPYFLLSAFPELARRFPRTGPASELVKQSLAFPMLATAAWLAGPRLVGDPAHWWLVAIVIAGGAGFIIARAVQLLKSGAGVVVTSAIALAIVGGTVAWAASWNHATWSNGWIEYSDDALARERAKNVPVVVKFTASWCANCQVVEATVFRDADTLAKLSARNVSLIKADLTLSKAPGWPALNRLGYTGIPLTAVYLPGQDEPILLDSIYTTSDLFAALRF
jgi:thiol:disulfide interchange protein